MVKKDTQLYQLLFSIFQINNAYELNASAAVV